MDVNESFIMIVAYGLVTCLSGFAIGASFMWFKLKIIPTIERWETRW